MIYLVALVILVLAVARLTRLVCKDDITAPWRLAIDRKLGADSFWSRLIWCPWCVGMWVSFAASGVAAWCGDVLNLYPGWFALPLQMFLTPAVAYAAAWIVDKEGD